MMVSIVKWQQALHYVGPVPIGRQVINMSKLSTCGTQVELLAASNLFKYLFMLLAKTSAFSLTV